MCKSADGGNRSSIGAAASADVRVAHPPGAWVLTCHAHLNLGAVARTNTHTGDD